MESAKNILPSALALMRGDKAPFIKRRAAEYADEYMRGGNAPALYMRDWESGVYTETDLIAVAELTDVYIAVKDGTYSRRHGTARQNEIIRKYYPR